MLISATDVPEYRERTLYGVCVCVFWLVCVCVCVCV